MKKLYFGVDKDGIVRSGLWDKDSILPEDQTMKMFDADELKEDEMIQIIEETTVGSEQTEATDYIQMKDDLWEASSKVVVDYFEQTQAESVGLEVENPMSAEEFKTWLVYRQELKAWDPVPDNPVPKRLQ